MPWSAKFEDPIDIPAGKPLITLEDAAGYIRKLPKAEHDKPHWQTAVEILINAAEGREPLMHARIGMLQAINHGKPKPEASPRVKRPRPVRIIPA